MSTFGQNTAIFIRNSISVLNTLKSVRDSGYEAMSRLKLDGNDISETKQKLEDLDGKINKLENDIKEFMAEYDISVSN